MPRRAEFNARRWILMQVVLQHGVVSIVFNMFCRQVLTRARGSYYMAQQQCLKCTRIVCPVGQYLHAPCLVSQGTTEAPLCRSCIMPANGMAFTSNGTDASGCNYTCKAGFWKSKSCEPSDTCYDRPGYWFDAVGSQCAKCEEDLQNKVFPYGISEPCEWFCVKGTYLGPASRCAYCRAGTYNTRAMTLETSCVSCAPGTYQASTGSTYGCIAVCLVLKQLQRAETLLPHAAAR
jgi:hypothetical protein